MQKHHKLARSLLSAGFAKELKPDAEERRRLQTLVQLPPTTRLREEDRELLWKVRYSLTKEQRALTKLLKCVDWTDAREVHQAHQLVQQWALVDVQDLLELLGHAFVGAAAWVREFAVAALRDRASDAQLLSYLLPLVQAIQYERGLQQPPAECPLAALLVLRALSNVELSSNLHWYLQVERCDVRHGSHYAQVHDAFLQQLQAAAPHLSIALRQQEALVGALSQAAQLLKASGESRPKRIQRLQAMFEHADMLGPLKSVTSPLLMLPLDPRLRIVSSLPQRATIFKSALTPLGLTFETVEVRPATESKGPTPYSIIFKSGDDLRQDQLVVQMLLLMDDLLKEQGLDLQVRVRARVRGRVRVRARIRVRVRVELRRRALPDEALVVLMEGVGAAAEPAVRALVVDARLDPSAEGDAQRLARERQQRATARRGGARTLGVAADGPRVVAVGGQGRLRGQSHDAHLVRVRARVRVRLRVRVRARARVR